MNARPWGSGARRCKPIDVMHMEEAAEIQRRIDQLNEEHRDLDAAIAALVEKMGHDQLQIARLKKRKLRIKDEISKLLDNLLPDIIA